LIHGEDHHASQAQRHDLRPGLHPGTVFHQ
jgi:hypothetical protein